MGLFDKFLKDSDSEIKYNPRFEQEAWIGIIYATAAIDGVVSDEERDTISRLFVFKSFFDGFDLVHFYQKAGTTWQQIGSKSIIDECVPLIADENKATLFCIVVEILLAGGMQEEEKKIIEYLQTALKIEDSIAEKIIEVMLIRNKWNKVLS